MQYITYPLPFKFFVLNSFQFTAALPEEINPPESVSTSTSASSSPTSDESQSLISSTKGTNLKLQEPGLSSVSERSTAEGTTASMSTNEAQQISTASTILVAGTSPKNPVSLHSATTDSITDKYTKSHPSSDFDILTTHNNEQIGVGITHSTPSLGTSDMTEANTQYPNLKTTWRFKLGSIQSGLYGETSEMSLQSENNDWTESITTRENVIDQTDAPTHTTMPRSSKAITDSLREILTIPNEKSEYSTKDITSSVVTLELNSPTEFKRSKSTSSPNHSDSITRVLKNIPTAPSSIADIVTTDQPVKSTIKNKIPPSSDDMTLHTTPSIESIQPVSETIGHSSYKETVSSSTMSTSTRKDYRITSTTITPTLTSDSPVLTTPEGNLFPAIPSQMKHVFP